MSLRFCEEKRKRGRGEVKTKANILIVLQQIFIQKAESQKRKVGGGNKSIHLLKELFK